MKNLIEIGKVVTRKKVKKIEIFDEYSLRNKNSKFNEFYELLASNKLRNDRDAATLLYNCSPRDARYRQLKSRFRRRLLNTLFFLDINKSQASNYDRALYSCQREWAQIKILQQYHANQTAESLTKGLLTVALKYQLTDITMNALRVLRDYAVHNQDRKAFEDYNEQIKHFGKIQSIEIRTEELHQKVELLYREYTVFDDKLKDEILQYSDNLLEFSETYDSPKILLCAYLVWTIRFEINRDYESLLQVCNQAIQIIEEKPDAFPQGKLLVFQTKKMLAYLHLKDYKFGQRSAEEVLKRFGEGTEEWLNFMEYYLLLALHTGQYIQALAIFNRAAAKVNYRKVESRIKDCWMLYEAYLHFIIGQSSFNMKVVNLRGMKGFQLTNFLQSSFDFSRRQRIFQILFTILQVLFLLDKKKYSNIDNLIQRLQYAANRQLKKEEHHRHIQFIRLLQQLRKADYDYDELGGTEKYLERLKEQPWVYRGLADQLEVIPYEDLWDMLKSMLKNA